MHARQGRLTRLSVLAVSAAFVGWLTACRPASGQRSTTSNAVLRIGMYQLPGAGLAELAQTLTLESLARLSDDGQPTPLLARDWTASADGRTVTLNLQPNVKFHDGSSVTAAGVADALKTTLPSFMGPAASDVESVSAVPPNQVVIRLQQPSPFLLDTLESTVSKPGSPLIGTGPFMVSDPNQPAELHANANYRLGAPAIDRVVVETYPSVRAAWAEMLRGQLDMLYEVGVDAMDSLQTSSSISVFRLLRRYQYVVVLNTKSQALRSRDVRRALNMAIDRNAVVAQALNGHGVASSGPVWPQNHGVRENAPAFHLDAGAASGLVTKATAVGSRTNMLRFTCLVRADAVHERIALTIKQQLQQVGIDMEVEQAPIDRIVGSMKSRQFEAVLTEMVSGPTLLRPYRMWHSGGAAGAESPTIDAALDRIRHAASEAEYVQAVSGFQEAVVDDPPAIFLAWMERARAVSKRFIVPAAEPGRDVMSNLRLWKPATDQRQASRN